MSLHSFITNRLFSLAKRVKARQGGLTYHDCEVSALKIMQVLALDNEARKAFVRYFPLAAYDPSTTDEASLQGQQLFAKDLCGAEYQPGVLSQRRGLREKRLSIRKAWKALPEEQRQKYRDRISKRRAELQKLKRVLRPRRHGKVGGTSHKDLQLPNATPLEMRWYLAQVYLNRRRTLTDEEKESQKASLFKEKVQAFMALKSLSDNLKRNAHKELELFQGSKRNLGFQ